MQKHTRREFITRTSLAGAATVVSRNSFAMMLHNLAASSNVKLGYAAITWGEDHIKFLEDVTSLGYKWIQLRNYLMNTYKDKPVEFQKILKRYKVKMAMYSLGNADINTGDDEAVLKELMQQAKFLKAIGGNYAMVTNNSRPKDGQPPTREQLITYAKLITELGRRTSAIGVTLTYHNHMEQLGETPEEVDLILEHADEKYVKVLLDIGHYAAGGGDSVKFIDNYRNRIKCLHIKDVKSPSPDTPDKSGSYKFLPLGEGQVDIPAVFSALKRVNFNGWALVELDYVPNISVSPYQTAVINHKYLTQKLKLRV
jgi:inosose dehydratase